MDVKCVICKGIFQVSPSKAAGRKTCGRPCQKRLFIQNKGQKMSMPVRKWAVRIALNCVSRETSQFVKAMEAAGLLEKIEEDSDCLRIDLFPPSLTSKKELWALGTSQKLRSFGFDARPTQV